MGQKQFVLVFRRNAFAGIGNGNFNSIGFRAQLRVDADFAEGFAFEGLGGVVNQVDNDAAEELAIGANGGEIWLQIYFEANAIEASGEELQSFANDNVRVGCLNLGGGEADELGKFVDERRKSGDFADNEAGTFLGDAGEFWIFGSFTGLLSAREQVRQALGG